MKKWIQLITFLAAFQMEVRVRASGDVLQQPTACLQGEEFCSLQVIGSGFHLERNNVKLHAIAGSTLIRNSTVSWKLVKGAVWIEKGATVELETLYGRMQSSQGQYWVIEQGDRVLVRNIDATLQATLRDGKVVQVPEGFEFWISGLNTKGMTEYGMIRPVNIKSHLQLWSSLYRGSKVDFVSEVNHLKANWGDLVEKSSSIYESVVHRELASELERRHQAEQRKLQAAEQRRQTKELFRQRVFER